MEQAHLNNAARLAKGVRGYTRTSVLRFGDWLIAEEGPNIVPGLMLERKHDSPPVPDIK